MLPENQKKCGGSLIIRDSIEIRFTPDENGNPGDERVYKKGVETSQYYYYY